MDPKIEEARKSLRKSYKKARGVLEQICSECQVSFTENFPEISQSSLDSMTEHQIRMATGEIKKEVAKLIKTFYLDAWLATSYKAYEGKELNDMVESLSLMIEMEPIYSYEHFANLFAVLNGLNSEREEEVINTLFMIRESASHLSTEEIINSYSELTRTKYKENVIFAIMDGMKKGPNKKHSQFIACYFNEKAVAGEKTLI